METTLVLILGCILIAIVGAAMTCTGRHKRDRYN